MRTSLLSLAISLALAFPALAAGEPDDPPGDTASKTDLAPPKAPSLDFDLLGASRPAPRVDDQALRLRRTLLDWHQGVGLAMVGLQLATTVVGQLNYDDKFGGANTNKYAQAHSLLAYSTFATFLAAGTLAIIAPAAPERRDGFDRISLHKIAMFTATGGMAAQIALGIWTTGREGNLNQQSLATAHLVLGYVTLAAVLTGVGALVF
jgi:hypothetical protein